MRISRHLRGKLICRIRAPNVSRSLQSLLIASTTQSVAFTADVFEIVIKFRCHDRLRIMLTCIIHGVMGKVFPRLCSVGYVQNHTRGIYRRYYPTKNFCKFCRTFIPVPGTCVGYVRHSHPYPESASSVRPCHKYPGYGYSFFYLPGTSVTSVRPCHNTRNFRDVCTRTRNFCEFCTPVPQYPELL